MKEQDQRTAERIRREYEEKKETKLDRMKRLDRAAKRPAAIFAIAFGTLGALTLGAGMCFSMKVVGDSLPLGVGLGLIGIAMVAANYFLYRRILSSRKKKYAAEILKLGNELLHE